jgi:hypothetical protein
MECEITAREVINGWRCRALDHDIYGFSDQMGAVMSEIDATSSRIYLENHWLAELMKKKRNMEDT